ncbi:MAG: hypothetical protein NZ556_07655 [Fimbriimonadales bacterium]|nr:hypothetical protein [Fimbriimonadales bacterium]
MDALRIRIGEQGKHVGLRDLQRITQHLQSALNALASEREEQRVKTDFEIIDASVGSMMLAILPVNGHIDSHWLFTQFLDDLENLTKARFRPTMFSQTLAEYRDLFATTTTIVFYEYREQSVRVDQSARELLEQQIVRTIAYNIKMIGKIESVNIHSSPYSCNFYTKLEPRQRVRCVVPKQLLPAVADALKSEQLVEVIGDAEYGPVGLYPLRLTLTHAPEPVQPDLQLLRSVVRSLDIIPEGVSVVEYLERLRDSHAQAV